MRFSLFVLLAALGLVQGCAAPVVAAVSECRGRRRHRGDFRGSPQRGRNG